ncbi:PREDICTED: uncharacterized protein LOC105515840 [Colobus angolensis palliatus]|uniref:uncharacterized protein LOC105515840 n=1 Tax=Colobus angolensis palliatus TaxID=336983 RepID=UPI0005F56B96|nr:PREDICTED: uncharacterized protein LOC105515840 [Colobus angolensis palliatus]
MELQSRDDPAESAEAPWTLPPLEERKGRTPGGRLRAACARGEGSTVAFSALRRTPTRVGRIRPCLGFGRGVAATLETLPGSGQADRGVTRRCPRVPAAAGLGTRGRPVGSGDLLRNSLQDGGGCRRAWEPVRGSAGLGTKGYRMSKARAAHS